MKGWMEPAFGSSQTSLTNTKTRLFISVHGLVLIPCTKDTARIPPISLYRASIVNQLDSCREGVEYNFALKKGGAISMLHGDYYIDGFFWLHRFRQPIR